MTSGDALMVDFREPPVVEVVAGVAYEGVGPATGALLAAFWKERLRSRFPNLEPQPPYTVPQESFEGTAIPSMRFGMMEGILPTRWWASSSDQQLLVQLQPGYFACNWRKVKPNDDYDHWPKRREAFIETYRDFVAYILDADVGSPQITQCEVSYINHIVPNDLWSRHADFERIFAASLSDSTVGRLEQITAQAQFVLESDGVPYGRLHVKILPAYARDGETPLYVLELTARGPSNDGGIEGALRFLDRGREAIVQAFLDLTTGEMQSRWGIDR